MPELIEKEELEKLRKFKRDVDWFQDHYESLRRQYKGQYVAVKDEKLRGHNRDADKLMTELRKKYGVISSFVIEHIDESKYVYVM